ncbi:uncharacterized protein [Euwallacea similis]|uniref:uncharacterized protein isoform X1 n=1 Tax=Euwallacea similis TaxID=1736056 RepID=UPI00344E7EE4
MVDAAINRRKSQLFFSQISPVYDTHDEVVRKKLKRGKFLPTTTGIFKMSSLCFQVGSLVSWSVLSQQCINLRISYANLSGISLGFIGQLLLLIFFSLGWTVKNPGLWINWDITFNTLVSLFTIITSIISLKMCEISQFSHMTEALALCGASLSICGCVALFLLYRYVEDPEDEKKAAKPRPDPRKSLFA